MNLRTCLRGVFGLSLLPLAAVAQTAPADQTLIERGEYLARAGDCLACHVVEGGRPYAGGLPIEMPFGTLYSTNITPDKETGIGNWSDDDFVKAMQQGVGPDGQHYYPAFPYTSFTLMPREDILAIKAYLFSLEPVRQQNPENDLRFPFDQRWGMALWNLLFLDDERFEPDPAQSEQWNRGRYLVEGPGHCAECHSPRNLFQARSGSKHLAGAEIQGWNAWNITADEEAGIGAWPDEALARYLRTGVAEGYGVAGGPMAEVVNHSLRHLTEADIDAMVVYLKTVEPQPADIGRPAPRELAAEVPAETAHPLGRKLFADACASCHQWDGSGRQTPYAALRGLRTVHDADGRNLLRILLDGGHLEGPDGHHLMPAFNRHFDDRELSDLGNFVLSHFGATEGRLTPEGVAERRKPGS
ncbi:c-type cytochrome [Stutzerimonas azotifigens]|uniref:c-type cytochrome n=1 Tax=Stutzerimonas azotifigens TaxID=291995 RepID=UPI00040D76E1|nr:cytochrome c [Stutzerimonas azotifigens]